MATTAPAIDLTQCATCSTSAADKPLLMCVRCKSVKYCSKDCQKEDWKSHKKQCGKLGNGFPGSASASNNPTSAQTGAGNAADDGNPDAKPFTAIHNGVYLHNRTQEKTYQILIDCLRMKQEDTYNIEQDNMDGTIFARLRNSEPAFRTMITKAKRVPNLLPPWWDDSSLEACLKYSRESEDFNLKFSAEKADIQKQWGDDMMPMKLRMVGGKIYGASPGGADGSSMLRLQMTMEGEDGPSGMLTSHLDLGGNFARR